MKRLSFIFVLFLFLVGLPLLSSVSLAEGTILNASSSGAAINFTISASVTMIIVEPTYVYIEGLSYSSGGTTYSCDYNHSQVNTLIAITSLCLPGSTTASSGGSGGGSTYMPSEKDFESGYKIKVTEGQKVEIPFDSGNKIVEINSIGENNIIVSIDYKNYEIILNDYVKIDLDDDGFYDLQISNNNIYKKTANLEFTLIYEKIPSDKEDEEKGNVGEIIDDISNVVKEDPWKLYVLIVAVLILLVLYIKLSFRKRKMRR